MYRRGVRGAGAWALAGVALLALSLAAGCPVKLASDYDQVFDSQLMEFQKKFDGFIVKLSVQGLKYCDPASVEFYDQDLPQQMRSMVSRALMQGMTTQGKPLGNLQSEDCSAPATPVTVGNVKPLCPLQSFKDGDRVRLKKAYLKAFKENWQDRKRLLFQPYDLQVLKCRCDRVVEGKLGAAIAQSELITLCQLSLLWDSLAGLALDHAVSSAAGKPLDLRQIAVHMDQVGAFIRNLMTLEKEKKRGRGQAQ